MTRFKASKIWQLKSRRPFDFRCFMQHSVSVSAEYIDAAQAILVPIKVKGEAVLSD